ncbi:MAG: hypothetical protein V7646_1948 [Pseudonocardia sp.]|jgi:hypothetical protein
MSEVRKHATWDVAAGREIGLDRFEPITTSSSPPRDHDCDYYRQPDGVCAYCGEERPTEPVWEFSTLGELAEDVFVRRLPVVP